MVKPGMRGAVEFGTAHRAREDGAIAGKTGTCSENHTHLGWFGSFNDVGDRKLVVVVLLTGGRPAIGPLAAGIAGDVYRRLGEKNYFPARSPGNHADSETASHARRFVKAGEDLAVELGVVFPALRGDDPAVANRRFVAVNSALALHFHTDMRVPGERLSVAKPAAVRTWTPCPTAQITWS